MTENLQQAIRRLAGPALGLGFVPEALHTYTDAAGNPLYWKARLRQSNTGEKWIRPIHKNGNGYELGEPSFEGGKPLYWLHVLKAKPGAPCWYVEGENCVEYLARLGILATTAGSATSDDKADFAPLAKRSVIIWPDNDEAGVEHGHRVAEKLRVLDCNVETLDVAKLELPASGDCVDWLKAHRSATPADLAKLPRVRVTSDANAGKTGDSAQAETLREKQATPSRAWPEPLASEAFYGLPGEIVRAVEPQTESDPAAILLQVLVAFGALVGRGPHVPIEGDEHHGNLFALIVGETSKARKGTSWGRVRQIFSRVTGWPQVVDGLSSGEGLKWAVRDRVTKTEKDDKGFAKEVETDPGVADKRILVMEPEFSQVLRQAARAGNTLSATIRSAWDSGNLRTMTKHDPLTATGAHVCIVGHITADELRAELTATDSANGFANRFLFMCAKRSKALAFGGDPLPADTVADFAQRIARAAGRAKGVRPVPMTPAAREAWKRVYEPLSEGYPGLFGAVTGRAEAQCLRLALLYALMDEAGTIDAPHLLAALAVWERAKDSARFIFGDALGDPIADEILRALRAAGAAGMTRTDISRLLGRHQTAERIGSALDLLERRGLASRESKPTAGAPAEVWRAR